MKRIENKEVLVSGASIAGMSTAWWLNKIGYKVTVVELAGAPRTAGGAVDLVGPAIVDIAKRMGLFEQLKSHRLRVDRIEYKNADDITEGTIVLNDDENEQSDDIEIERDKFVEVIFSDLKNEVEFIFNDSVTALEETNDSVIVNFKNSRGRNFDLVIGCDGAHSGIRKIWFGPEKDYAHFLEAYFSISIVNKLLVPQKTMQMYSIPYKSVMLNGYNNKTDIIFTFVSAQEITYDYRNFAQHQQIIKENFEGQGWRIAELFEEVDASGNFYFDKFCQIKMQSWSKGRVALVGDAAYCASPAAGQGASLSLHGAAGIADALLKHQGDYTIAFQEYEQNLRPLIKKVQAAAEMNVKENFMLKTEEEIRMRNTEAKSF